MKIKPDLFYSTLFALLTTACSSDETVSTAGVSEVPAEPNGLQVRVLSTMPWLVSGGDVLVEVNLVSGMSAAQLRVTVNKEEVTEEFIAVGSERMQALLTGLPLGESELKASLTGSGESNSLILTNYPITGPIISGPHETPFYCQANDFELVSGGTLGRVNDSACSIETRVDYVYWSIREASFKPLTDQLRRLLLENEAIAGVPELIVAEAGEQTENPAADIGKLLDYRGKTIPYIVRVETGTVNRAIYEIAMLHNPSEGDVDPWNRSINWNGKLVYTHGGGCRSGWYQQGNRTGGVMRQGLLEHGYAVMSSSLNVFGQNCNDLLASETHIMAKERFIETYGIPIYTIATGASGGSYQSHQTADNYPGVFDGIIVAASFPDVTSATIFTLADSRLLNYYFSQTNPELFSPEQQRAVAGYGSWASIPSLARSAARLDPTYRLDAPAEEQGGEVSIPELESQRYSFSNPNGVRTTVYDHTINVYGAVPDTFIARRPLDNSGVQYGLAALNEGVIAPQQFIALNRGIGGFDRDMNHVSERHRADAEAGKRAIESGRILYGGAGLATTPVIDYRSYTDHAENGDIHMIVHQYSTRQRLLNANGHAKNHVMQVGGLWGFTEDQPDLAELFRQMDVWLIAIQTDESSIEYSEKVVNNKPTSLVDACWDYSGEERIKYEQLQTFRGSSACNELYTAYPTPRHVAGAPLANNIVSCHLRELDPLDYSVTFSGEEYAELEQIFSEGVCDWSRGDASGARYQGTWVSFGPSPINRLY